MNYKRIYDELIVRAQRRAKPKGYTERHHIIPRSLGGSDDQFNLIDLTAREHFIAHMCLSFIYGGSQWYAISMMKGRYNNSKLYEIARKQFVLTRKNVPLSEEHSKKVVAALKITMTPEKIKQRGIAISLSKKGKPLSDNNKNALRGKRGTWSESRRQAHKVKTQTPESNLKRKLALKGVAKSPEHIAAVIAGKEKAKFNRECISLNNLIDSVFQPSAVGC